jgi:hypothetical protein
MTFIELDTVIANTGRRSLAARLVFTLADCLDNKINGIDLDVFEATSGYTRTNIRAVASFLKDAGVIEIDYYRVIGEDEKRITLTASAKNRWAKLHYRLSKEVVRLLNR